MVMLDGILVGEYIPPVSAFPTVGHLGKNVSRNISRPIQRSTIRVVVILVKDGHVLLGIEQLRTLVNVRPADSTIVTEFNLTSLTLLGGHEDHTVSSTCTVDGSRSSILQHVDALDIVRVDAVKATTCHTVNHIERSVVTDGALTTDVHIVSFTRL